MLYSTAIMIVAAMTITSCCKTGPGDVPSPSPDRQFATRAAYANLAAMSAGSLVAAQGEDPAIRAFARTTAEEHHAAHEELQKIGDTINLSLPTDLDSLGAVMIRQLSARSGRDLDTTYLAAQLAQFHKSIDNCQSEIKTGKSPTVIRYATESLEHFQAAVRTGESLRQNSRFK